MKPHRWKDIPDLDPGPSCTGCERLGRYVPFEDCPYASDENKKAYDDWQRIVRLDRQLTGTPVLRNLGEWWYHRHHMWAVELEKPGLVEVYVKVEYDGAESEETVCRIHNCDLGKPTPLFDGRWNANYPLWKKGVVDAALGQYRKTLALP